MPPDAASIQGQATRNIYDIVFVIGAAIFFLVEGLILFAVIRYRRRKGDDELPPQIHGNNKLEIIWTAIPIAIVLALFVVSWQTLNTIDARKADPPVRIGVVAYQWQWQFVYAPQGVRWEDCSAPENQGKCVTVIGLPPPNNDRTDWIPPQMHVPIGETVELQMHATDVIHSFYVPAFLYQRDITPRKDQVIQFLADREGTYRGQCTQFCGLLHQQMEFEVVVESRDAFNAWLDQGAHPAPDSQPGPVHQLRAGRQPGAGPVGHAQDLRPGHGLRHRHPGGAGEHGRSRSSSPTTTPGSPTTWRSTRTARPAPRSGRARSSTASGPGPTTCRPCRPAPTASSARSTRT